MKIWQHKTYFLPAIFSVFITITSSAHASSSQLFLNNVSGLGNAYSGVAVLADDPSIEYFNPAGLSLIDHPQVMLGEVVGRYDGQFNGATVFSAGPLNITQTGQVRGQAVLAPYPFIYYAQPVTNKITFGIGLLTPFGIGVSIPEHSIARYIGTRFITYVIDLSPAVSYKFNDIFSAGFGLDFQRLTLLTRAMFPSFTGGPDAKVQNTTNSNLHGWGYGWHAGLLFQIRPTTRLGVAYHSQTVFQARGESNYTFTPGNNVGLEIVSNNFKFSQTLPPTTTLSVLQEVNPHWTLLGTIDYSQWGMVRHFIFKNVAAPSPTGLASQVTFIFPQEYRDTLRFAAGTNYKINCQWTLRFGLAYENDPTNAKYRPLIDPGSAGTSVAVGLHYQVIRNAGFDLGYMHVFIPSSSINTTSGFNTQVGRDHLQHDMAGLQVNWDFI